VGCGHSWVRLAATARQPMDLLVSDIVENFSFFLTQTMSLAKKSLLRSGETSRLNRCQVEVQ
jgi:hypothetical protein